MASLSEMRSAIKGMYGPVVRGKAVDYMQERQIYCIYQSVVAKKKKMQAVEATIERAKKAQSYEYHQMTISEWLQD